MSIGDAPIRLLREGPVATLLLDRADRRNAMSRAMWTAMPALLARVAADDAVALLVVTGTGGHFCAGADIAEFEDAYRDAAAVAATNAAIRDAVEALAAFPKPAIAAIRGACVGGGVALALACDLRVAASDARFAVTPARLGLIYSHGDTLRLVRAVGAARAKDMLFSARMVGAEEAERIGLVQRVVPPEALEATVSDTAAGLAALSRPALRDIKRMVGAIADGALQETPDLAALFADGFAGEDFREGYAAFLEKRPPRFRAR
ncbi:enoyl-CoA hydratase/isomerase family protein [Roseomonas sp. HF4]|uniref:enoyl-CoA hydratase/isomerase family protein n=1 Tax=Roseomonas sp. HF4 TaxID=2562313 RepID=UPI0010C0D029|nr:enoyl-CoA hydratase-related protein [Roseomonas sp. HF4]